PNLFKLQGYNTFCSRIGKKRLVLITTRFLIQSNSSLVGSSKWVHLITKHGNCGFHIPYLERQAGVTTFAFCQAERLTICC
ncbi:MAG: hypothetical protein P8M80_10740, partial [Pirellulaceae bacterium]|nr:hypothetical protein [Pirellulaceae bacterium]